MSPSDTSSSEALARLKKAKPSSASAPSALSPDSTTSPVSSQVTTTPEPAQSPETGKPATPEPAAPAQQPGQQPAERRAHQPTTKPNAKKTQRDQKPSLKTRFNNWLDNLGGPDSETVERVIADSPARAHRWWQDTKAERAARKARAEEQRQAELKKAEERAQLEAEVNELREILAEQEEQRQQLAAERRRAEQRELIEIQQERETKALIVAARELDGTDYVPPASHRPMIQNLDEYLSDEQLVDRARALLPEWRRRDRIVEKAQAIEARHQALVAETAPEPEPSTDTGSLGLDHLDGAAYIPPHMLPDIDENPPVALDSWRQIFVTAATATLAILGLWGLGWLGAGESLHRINDGAYSGAATFLSMASWHVLIWPVIWVVGVLYMIHQWRSDQHTASRQRASGWLLGASMFSMAAWFVLVRVQDLGLEIIAWAAATVLAVMAMIKINAMPARSGHARALTDGFASVLTGWALGFLPTALFASLKIWNIADLFWLPELIWAIAVLVVLMLFVPMLTMTDRGRIGLAVAFTWAMAAIIGSNLFGKNSSTILVVIAGIGAFMVLLATENRRYKISRAERHMLGPTEDLELSNRAEP